MKISIKPALKMLLLGLMVGLAGCTYAQSVPDTTSGGTADAASKAQPNKPMPISTESITEAEPDVRANDSQLDRHLAEKEQPAKGLFATTLNTVTEDGALTIRFSLQNISGKAQQISHGSGQQYDIWVTNEQGEEVYRWSINKAFTQALIVRGLKESGQLNFEELWNMRNTRGERVPAGTYTVAVEVMVGLESGTTISRDELLAQSTIHIDAPPAPHSVEVSFYNRDSIKGQPELINMYTNLSAPEKVKAFSFWAASGKSNVTVEASNVNRLFLIRLDSGAANSEYYLCVYTNDKNVYLKKVPEDQVQNVQLEEYDTSLNNRLIEAVGADGWVKTSDIPQ